MSKKYLLECAVDSVESAMAAQAGGADRLELCSNLVIGGTTPSLILFRKIKECCEIPVYVLIRPRFGDFLYSPLEEEVICREIQMFQKEGADGIVVGSLKEDGSLHQEQMRYFITYAPNLPVTLHRAFDMCNNQLEALEQAKKLGITTILTSAGESDCIAGIPMYQKLLEKAGEEVTILAGAGVHKDTIPLLLEKTDLKAFHMSGKEVCESKMRYRNPKIFMGLPGISEYEQWYTMEKNISEVQQILRNHR